ncbi:hypothetical protein AB9P05_24140 [Roseivirga sp. BDSF3-8]|uniref:hypothetical protein n=1 Tax=Roseivirga sp. BDSF3-8 TaxID=3241598 RepID=UPI003532080C
MTRYLFVFIFLISCQPASSAVNTPGEMPDSLQHLVEDYERQTMVLSCSWCRVNHASFLPVITYVTQHPDTMPFLFDKAESDPLFRFAYIRLLQEVKPGLYRQLLEANHISLRPPDPASREATDAYYNRVYSMDWEEIKKLSQETE